MRIPVVVTVASRLHLVNWGQSTVNFLILGALLVAAVLVPHLTFLLFGSAGRDLITGAVPGYWAMLVQPLALALAPVAWVQLGHPHKIDSCLRLYNKDQRHF